MTATLIAIAGVLAVAVLLAISVGRKPRREPDEAFEPPADDHLWDVLRGGRE